MGGVAIRVVVVGDCNLELVLVECGWNGHSLVGPGDT